MADVNITFGADDLKKVVSEIQKAAKALNTALAKTGTIVEGDKNRAKQLATETKKLSALKRERAKTEKFLKDAVGKRLHMDEKSFILSEKARFSMQKRKVPTTCGLVPKGPITMLNESFVSS